MLAIEYQMVIEPGPAARDAGFRTRHYTYPKPSYEKARDGVLNFLAERDSGRFEKTWMQYAIVYIETREVSKWQRLDTSDVVVTAIRNSTTSRPDS